jgi:hypothetical protein
MSIEFLRFRRKLCESEGNKSSLMSIPRLIANMWKDYDEIEFIFDGERLIGVPVEKDEEVN